MPPTRTSPMTSRSVRRRNGLSRLRSPSTASPSTPISTALRLTRLRRSHESRDRECSALREPLDRHQSPQGARAADLCSSPSGRLPLVVVAQRPETRRPCLHHVSRRSTSDARRRDRRSADRRVLAVWIWGARGVSRIGRGLPPEPLRPTRGRRRAEHFARRAGLLMSGGSVLNVIRCQDPRRIAASALDQGWEWIGYTRAGHVEFRWPATDTRLHCATTPSDRNAWKAFARNIKQVSGVETWEKSNHRRPRKKADKSAEVQLEASRR